MPRRIEIELTSAQPDGTWTWRAAGALQPRGVLDGALLYEGAKAGDVVRAEAEFEIEGITVISVMPPKTKKRSEPERIELIAPSRPVPGVTTQLAGGNRRPSDRPDRRPREGAREGGPRGPRRSDGAVPGTQGAPSGERRPRPAGREGAPGRSAPREGGRDFAGRDSGREGGPARPRRDGPGQQGAGREGAGRPAGRDGAGRGTAERRERIEDRERGRRLTPGNVHRSAMLEALAPEERPIAEQLLRGWIPAVRTALSLEREKAREEGRQEPNAEAILAMAEGLLPRVKSAEWRDRADAAAKAGDEVSLRDLRSIVSAADLARDDESRSIAAALRDSLDRRIQAQHQSWIDDIVSHLDESRVVRALRLSARPPDPGARLSAELAARLSEAASQAMSPETAPDRWAALLEAAVASPLRRTIKPVGLPAEPGEDLLQAARQQSGRLPALAPMLGIAMPPPPGPVRRPGPGGPGGAPSRSGSGPRPGGGRRPGGNAPATSGGPRPAPAERPAPVEAPADPSAPAEEALASTEIVADAHGPALATPVTEAPEAMPNAEAPADEAPEAEAPTAEAAEAEAPTAEAAEAEAPEAGLADEAKESTVESSPAPTAEAEPVVTETSDAGDEPAPVTSDGAASRDETDVADHEAGAN